MAQSTCNIFEKWKASGQNWSEYSIIKYMIVSVGEGNKVRNICDMWKTSYVREFLERSVFK
jgi:hypothetical protein